MIHEILRKEFRLAYIFVFLIGVGYFWHVPVAWLLVQMGGLIILIKESWERIALKKWNLDYLALLTLITAFVMEEWLLVS